MKTWKHYERWQDGSTEVSQRGQNSTCCYQIGGTTTGKQRVFQCYYIRLTLPDGSEAIGMDRHNLRQALFHLAKKLEDSGIKLAVAGLDEKFYETGLSHNSGLGYIDDIGRIGMMEPVPEVV